MTSSTLDTAYGYHRSRQSPDDPRGQHGQRARMVRLTVFAIFAVYFSNHFFHSDNEVSNLLSTMAVFAVGFVMRPLAVCSSDSSPTAAAASSSWC